MSVNRFKKRVVRSIESWLLLMLLLVLLLLREEEEEEVVVAALWMRSDREGCEVEGEDCLFLGGVAVVVSHVSRCMKLGPAAKMGVGIEEEGGGEVPRERKGARRSR